MRCLVFSFLLVCSLMRAQITLIKGPYLQIGTPGSMIIRWETNIPTNSMVQYGTNAASLSFFSGSLLSDTVHEIQLTGLSPYTKYYYTVGTTASVVQGDTNNYFVTSPLSGQTGKYRFWATGDCGNGSVNQMNCKNQYNTYNGNRLTNGWLLLGDNAYYYGSNYEYNTEFFGVYQTDIMKHAVLWPTPGNHDYDNKGTVLPTVPYYKVFTMPATAQAGGIASGTECYYSYDYGNIHFISLDSYGTNGNLKMYDTTSAQAQWVKQDLAANTKQWTIAYWHHPPYDMTNHNSDTEKDLDSIRVNFIRIMERYKVDLIMCGHGHGYERSKLMKGHYGPEASFNSSLHQLDTSNALYNGTINSCPYIKDSLNKKDGTVYVVSGTAGQLMGITQPSFPHDAMFYSDVTNGGSVVLDIEANRLDLKWLCADGIIRDKFTMFKNVNKVTAFTITPTQTITLNASWPGNYIWSNADTTRTSAVSPTINTTYWVKDKFNCIADTFKVFVLPVGINEFANAKNKTFSVYPNPAKENVTIKLVLEQNSEVGIKIISSSGQIIRSFEDKKYPAGDNRISLLNNDLKLTSGIYIVTVTINNVSFSERLIISK